MSGQETKKTRLSGELASSCSRGTTLRSIFGSLLGRIWPRDRVLLGLRTSKWIREELKQNAVAVLFSVQLNLRREDGNESADPGVDWGSVCNSWTMFSGRDQGVWVRMVGNPFGAIDAEAFLPRRLEILGLLTKSVPDGLKCNLVHLDLRRAMIGNEGAGMLSTVVGDCKSLKYLNLSENNISDDGIAALAAGECGTAGSGLAGCEALTDLDLSLNESIAEAMHSLSTSLVQCTALSRLNLSNVNLGAYAPGVKALAEMLRNCKALSCLRLRENSFIEGGTDALAEGLGQLTTLTHLDVGINSYFHADHSKFLGMLQTSASLRRLELDWIELGDSGATELAEALTGACTGLQHLNLAGNGIGPEGFERLQEGLRCCEQLESLDVRSNQVGMQSLAVVLGALSRLQRLDLAKNKIGDSGIRALSESGSVWARLQSLDLHRNRFGPEGTRALAVVLSKCSSLVSLDVSHNEIGATGAGRLAGSLAKHSRLQRLKVRNTYIAPAGARKLAEVLSTCRSLTHVDMRCCKVGDAGAACVAAAVGSCPGLKHLDLAVNAVGDRGATKVAEALRGCKSLTCLDLRGSRFGSKGRARLVELQQTSNCPSLSHLELEDDGYFCA